MQLDPALHLLRRGSPDPLTLPCIAPRQSPQWGQPMGPWLPLDSPLFPPGLRKLEAFFGLLITIMAVTFGYEVSDPPPPQACPPCSP